MRKEGFPSIILYEKYRPAIEMYLSCEVFEYVFSGSDVKMNVPIPGKPRKGLTSLHHGKEIFEIPCRICFTTLSSDLLNSALL